MANATRINPMNRTGYAFDNAPRCTATSKRTGQPCQAPAVRGWRVCRFHGARGGAPTDEANGRYRHGRKTKAVKAERRAMAALLQQVRETVASLSKGG